MNMTTTWMLRQNPCGKSDQNGMMEFLRKEKIITCPYGHIPEASGHVDRRAFGVYTEDGNQSLQQDRRFVHDIKKGDIVVIPFAKKENQRLLIVRVESDVCPSRSFRNMFVIYHHGDVVRITPQVEENHLGSGYEIKLFRPVYRKVSIIMEVPRPVDGDAMFTPRSLCKASAPLQNWLRQFF